MSFFMRYSDQKPDAAINEIVSDVLKAAAVKFAGQAFGGEWPLSGYGITTMRPWHIQPGGALWGSSHYWISSFSASHTWDNWINITQTDLAFEIITGQFNLETIPKEVEIYFNMDGKDLPTVNIEEAYALDISRIFWKKPISVGPEKPWDFFHKGTNTGREREGFLGYTVATRSFLILRN